MNIIKTHRKRSIGTLVVLLIVLSFIFAPSLLFSNFNFGSGFIDEEQSLNLSTNYLFKGTTYTFNLDDFYDDENLYKVYTGAKFQTEDFNGTDWSGTVLNDTVTPVDNDETQYGDPSGYYNATYGFDDDDVGTEPDGWTTINDADCTTTIVDSVGDHKNVLALVDGNAAGTAQAYNEFTQTVFGMVEYWIQSSNTGNLQYFQTKGDSHGIFLGFTGDFIKYYNGTAWNPIASVVDDTWYHIRIDFECGAGLYQGLLADTFYIYVDGIQYGAYPFRAGCTYLNTQRFYTYSGSTGYTMYVDAVGFKTGTYLATYGFDDQPVGTSGSDINGILSVQTPQDAIIIENYFGHSKVINITWEDACRYYKIYFDYISPTSGTIETWIKLASDETESFQWQFMSDLNSYMTYFTIYTTQLRLYHDGGYTIHMIDTTSDWFHVKLQFDYSTYKISYWVNSILVVDDLLMHTQTGSYLYKPRIQINTVNAGNMFLDSVGYYPWDPDYNIGDNLEGWDKDYTIGENLYPDNINMINGSYDYSDNMKVNDASYTTFTSTHTDGYIYETPSQWDNFTFTEGSAGEIGEIETIDADYSTLISTEAVAAPDDEFINSVTYTTGSPGAEPLSNSYTDNTYYYQMNSELDYGNHWISVEFVFDPSLAGRDFLISAHIDTTGDASVNLKINDVSWKTGLEIDFDDEPKTGVTSIKFTTWSEATAHDSKVYYFKIVEDISPVPAELDVQVDFGVDDVDLSSIEFLKFSHKTNISVDVDLDIWNWDTSTWYEIESVINFATFDDDSFTLGVDSDYVNSSFGVRMRFQATTSADFELQIDRLRLDYLTVPVAELEFTITFTFANYNEDLLAMTIQSWQKTNISQTITFKIWNYDTESYTQISSSSDTSFTKKEYNTISPSNFISPTGVVKLYWVGLNTTNDFELHIDYLFIQIFYKLDLVHEKSFDTNGIYRYRWEITGSIHYTQWVVFEVVDPVPNFHAISESDNPTRWILQNASLTPVQNFTDDMSGVDWTIADVVYDDINLSLIATDDAYVDEWLGNGYDTQNLYVARITLFSNWYNYYTYIKYELPNYLLTNITTNSFFRAYFYDSANTPDVRAYLTGDFDEKTINWANKPALDAWQATTTINDVDGWKDIDLVSVYDYYALTTTTNNDVAFFYSSEKFGYQPTINHFISKFYQGGGLVYMQTNETETITLQSTTYGSNYTLNSGDYFQVDFQTSSDSQINLVLLKDSVVNKTLTLSQSGNTNFNNQTVQVSVDEDVDFDQLKISSTFEDLDNVKVYDIKTYKYEIAGDYKDICVGSKRTEEVYLTPDIYNLRINDPYDGDVKINTNITIDSSDYYYIYTPTQTQYCRLALFNTEGTSLTFIDYHVKVNRSLNGEYNQFWLLDTIFYADDESYVYIDVYDRFDSLIGSFERLASDYIDLEIEVYSLQIKNLQTQKTTVDINTTHVYPLLSEESIYFMLSKNYYQIGYYDTNDVYKQFLIYLNSNQAYELNRSKICFLAYVNQKGEHLYFDDYKTYINDSLIYENVFYREIGDDIAIEIKDIYGISIKNQTYTVISGDNYIPVILTQYSLKVMSQQLCFNHINITRDPNYYESSYYWSEWIAPSEIIEFRLFAGYYKINLTNNEEESSSYYSYTLNGDDILLISSDNTIYNVLFNIANVNTTIGNQITNVQIDLTNQNSNINNTIINIEINLGNINSTLGSLLINIDTAISNINSSIISEIVSLGTEINNINSSITNEILTVSTAITNVNSSVISQILSLGVDISNINGSIVNQIIDLGVDVSNINTSLSNQILSIGVDISNLDTSITNQILSVVANIENVNASIIDQTLVILSDISNTNSTLLNQMVVLGVDVTNINVSITNQILSLSVDLTNINSSISNLLTNINISISNLENDIGAFYAFTSNSFINLNNVMNTSFINIENNIYSINQTISNLVIGVGNDIYLINGTISTMITQIETNLLLMNVSIDTALFALGTTLDLIGSNITSNFILINNSIYLNSLNINDSRIAMINNLLLVNNTISTLISEVYSAVYLINNSIYTAVVDLGTYLSLMNNNIYGNLSIVLEMNEFLTELYQMTMFSDLLNWTNVGLNISLLTSQIDAWTFINNYRNQSIEVHLRYQDLIEKLVVSADDMIEQYLPYDGVEYRLWSEELQEYVDEWKELDPDNKTVDFGFYEIEVPYDPKPLVFDTMTLIAFIVVICVIGWVIVIAWAYMKRDRDKVPKKTRNLYKNKNKGWRKPGTFRDEGI